MKKYYPILLSKKGELVALQQLEQSVKEGIVPIIQVLEQTLLKEIKVKNPKTKKKEPTGEYEYDNTFEETLKKHWVFPDNQVILDFSLYSDIHSSIKVVKQLIKQLLRAGVNTLLAVQKNSNKSYMDLVIELINEFDCKICIKTSNDSGGILNYNKNINELAAKFNRKPASIVLLFDLGQITKDNYNERGTVAGLSLQTLTPSIVKWKAVVVSSSSFPKDLTDFSNRKEPHIIKRYEWKAYKELQEVDALKYVKYGDYGTKAAIFEDVKFAGTVSLKYSTKDEYVIYRGKKSGDDDDGNRQFINHSKSLVSPDYYSGDDFCWGDLRYNEISKESMRTGKPGNAANWVQLSQNHHVTLLHSLF